VDAKKTQLEFKSVLPLRRLKIGERKEKEITFYTNTGNYRNK